MCQTGTANHIALSVELFKRQIPILCTRLPGSMKFASMHASAQPPLPVRDKLFSELMALSKACLEEPGLSAILDYGEYLKQAELTADFLRPITKFLVYPLQIIVTKLPEFVLKCKVPTSYEQVLLHSLDCLETILSKIAPLSDSATFDIFFTIFITLLNQENDSNSSTKTLPRLSEDIRLALLHHLHTLLVVCDQSVFNTKLLTDSQFKFKLGFFINLMINLIKKPKQYFKIQQAALNLLSVFYLKLISLPFDTFAFRIVLRGGLETTACAIQFTAFTLPSVASSIQKLIKVCFGGGNHYKLHSDVIEASLKLLAIVLEVTFNTGQTFSKEEMAEVITSKAPDPATPEVTFNQAWFDETTDRLRHILRTTFDTLLEHPDITVRATLQEVASSLILNTCTKFMLRFVDILIRVPIAHFEELQCAQFIKQFRERTATLPEADFYQLRNTLEGELLSQISLLSLVESRDSAELVSSFRILTGFFQILNPESLFHPFLLIDQHKFQLFRALIKISQFDYTRRIQNVTVEDLDSNASTQPCNQQAVDLFGALELHQYLLYLESAPLVTAYLNCVRKLFVNERSFHIFYDHLLQLLHESHFDPAILLLFNALLSGMPDQIVPQLRHYISELLKLYCMHLDLSQLRHFEEEEQHPDDALKPMSIGNLATICAPTNALVDPAEADQTPTKTKSEKRFVYQQCLLLQGITICNALLYRLDSAYQTEFFRTRFCHFLEAYSSDIQLVSAVAKGMLLFLGTKFNCGNGDVATMVLHNLDYLYSSLTVAFDFDILQQKDDTCWRGLDVAMFRVDQYSLQTVQASLETILRLLRQLHRATRAVDLKHLHYFHRLIGQILNVIKYYSIHPLPRYSSSLNRLLTILYAYLELIEAVCDQNAQCSRRIEEQGHKDVANSAVASLAEYITSYQFMVEQTKLEFKDDDVSVGVDEETIITQMEDDEQTEEKEKESILESPIVQSRAADILHQCSLILSDANVDIRLNVLLLACKSMKLLRSYEDILLPYVHKLWDPLVARFNVESDHPLILSRAYGCLLLASEFCGDFLLSRTRKEILPRLIAFLHAKLDHRIAYFTANRRLLTVKSVEYFAEHELLHSIGQLTSNLKLKSKDLWAVCPLLLMYIALKPIPPELQQCAFESLVELARYDTGSVRFYLHRIRKMYYEREDSQQQKEAPDCCECHPIELRLEECTGKWRRYFERWNDSLLRDLTGHLDAL